jgi:short-subunit dehydrogenase
MEIKNKVAIVTGASSGIGAAVAKLLVAGGAQVVLVARSADKLAQLASELPGSLALTADMTKEDEVKGMVAEVQQHFGRTDILINNAGSGYSASVIDIELSKARYLFELNVIGPLVAMQAVIPLMRQQGGGLIVNISSGVSLMVLPSLAFYNATKRSLNAISLTARAELAADNIKVSLVYPYATATDFSKNLLVSGQRPDWPVRSEANLPPPDSADYVAEKVLAVIVSEAPELAVHDWMKDLGRPQ